ncbi:RecX family transcriptional regulator [Bacillaceae bacterium]
MSFFSPPPEGEITRLERDKTDRQRIRIYVNGEYAFSAHEEIVVKYRLLKGKVITPALWREVIAAQERNVAERLALKYLRYRPRTEKELDDYLAQRKVPAPVAEEIKRSFKNKGYLDDERFAERWVEERLRWKPRGRLRIRQELREKGIGETIVAKVLANLDATKELEAARRDAQKKWGRMRHEPWRKMGGKLAQYLLRKGYPGSVVQAVLNEYRQLHREKEEEGDGFFLDNGFNK